MFFLRIQVKTQILFPKEKIRVDAGKSIIYNLYVKRTETARRAARTGRKHYG